MSIPRFAIVAAAALIAAVGCHSASGQLGNESAAVQLSPSAIDFGNVFVGAKPQLILSVSNNGGAPDTVTVALLAGGVFTAASGSFTVAGGASEGVAITFLPTQPGAAQATLHVGWTGGSADVPLAGIGLAWPACAPQGLCGAATFDPESGVCSQTTLADGTACSDPGGCLTGASCVAGQCLGTVATCDDGDACTADVCVLGQGCQHTPVVCAPTGNPCQPNSCDPSLGCVATHLSDGTPCASTESCQAATICVAGACTGTPVPDGTPCALSWEPCAGDAACKGGSCDSPTADALQPGAVLWASPSGVGSQGGLAVDGDGGVYFVTAGSGASNGQVVGLDQCGNSRWTSSVSVDSDVMLDGDQLVAFDSSVPRLLGIDTASGATRWQLPLPGVLSAMCPASDFGGGGHGGASLSFPVMSAQGQIFVAGSCAGQDGGSVAFLLAAFRDGSVDWLIPAPYADAAPVVDPSGDVYLVTSEGGGSQSLSSFDPSGVSRFTPVAYGGESDVQLVVGSTEVVDIANGSAFGLDGSAGFDVDVESGPFANAFYDSLQAKGGAIDGAGNVYLPFQGKSSLEWGGVSPSGSLLWSLGFSGDDDVASFPVLSADGTLFSVETEGQDNPEWRTAPQPMLTAIDAASGKALWSKPSGAASSLALGPSGLLLLAGSSVQSVYAGQLQPSATAPWSRYRGGNSNRGGPF